MSVQVAAVAVHQSHFGPSKKRLSKFVRLSVRLSDSSFYTQEHVHDSEI